MLLTFELSLEPHFPEIYIKKQQFYGKIVLGFICFGGFKFFSFGMYVYVSIFGIHAPMCKCGGQRSALGVIPQACLPCLNRVSHDPGLASQARAKSKPLGSSCFCLPSYHTWLFHVGLGIEIRLLPTGLSSWPALEFLQKLLNSLSSQSATESALCVCLFFHKQVSLGMCFALLVTAL